MVYCVTGSAGHLGSHVVKALIERGDSVRALVLPGEHCPDYVPRSGLLTEIEGDVRDISSLGRLMEGLGGEAVLIHCAGIVEITGKSNRRLYEVNVGGTENVLSACKQYGARRLIYQFRTRDPHPAQGRGDAGDRRLQPRRRIRPLRQE